MDHQCNAGKNKKNKSFPLFFWNCKANFHACNFQLHLYRIEDHWSFLRPSLGLRCFASFCCCLMTRQNLPNYVFLETIPWSFTSSSRLLFISVGYWYCGLTSFVCTCSMHFDVLFNSVKPWSFWEIGSFIFYFLIYINFGFYHSLIGTFVQVAVFYFHDEFTFLKGIGLVTIMFGVSLFNWYK